MPKQKGTEIVDILRYEKQILLMKRIIDEIMEPTEEEKKTRPCLNKRQRRENLCGTTLVLTVRQHSFARYRARTGAAY